MALNVVRDDETLRDRPAGLRLTATACTLAKAIYYARAEAFGIAVKAWETLDAMDRHRYVGHARDVLETVRPVDRPNRVLFDLAAGLARGEAAKVVGAITPEAPYGVEPDARD